MSIHFPKYKNHWKLLLAISLTGLFTTSGQILILREVMYLAQGNEFSLGLILFLYISLTALGSFFAAKRIEIRKNDNLIGIILLVAAVTLPLVIVGLTFARIFLVDTPTELIPITPLFFYLSLIITPCCLAFGSLLPLLAKLLGDVTSQENAFDVTFLFESIGGGIGGSIIFLLVIPHIQPINMAFTISIFIIITILLTIHFLKMPKLFIHMVGVIGIVVLSLAVSNYTHIWLKKVQWQDLHYISGESSKYGYVEVVQNGTQNNIYENGALVATENASDVNRDIFKIAFLQAPEIQNILLIGGGLNGLLGDIQRLNVKRCDYLEPNKQLFQFIKKYLPQQLTETEKLSVYNTDEITFFKNNINTYDLIILSKSAPSTLNNNRFYTVEYYQKLYNILGKQGLFFFSTESSSTYINEENAKYLTSLYKSLKQVFPIVEIIPGDDCIFLASKSDSFRLNTGDKENKNKQIYFDLLFRKNIPIEHDNLQQTINNNLSRIETNGDFKPHGYIYNILQGSNFLFTPFYSLIKYVERVNFINILIIFAVIVSFYFVYLIWNKSFPYHTTSFIIGFTSMAMQLIIMLVFQVIHGFLFYQLGVLIALFMIGLSIGGGLIIFLKQSPFKNMHTALMGNCCAMILIVLIFLVFSRINNIPIFVFNSFSILLGIVSGFFFLSINYLQEYSIKHNVATIYGFNLLGTSLGALLAPLFLGIWGMSNFCLIIILINITCLIMIMTFKCD